MQFNANTFLITGGGGSIGSALAKGILERYNPASVRIFDNNDYLLAKIQREIDDSRLRCLLGNVQDYQRLEMATEGVDYIFHLAAIKDVSVTEYNPIETIKTNIMGIVNLIECCLRSKPKKFINVSSDKAIGFSTLYGATKFISEKVTLWGHQVSYPKTIFSCIRLGNVIETRGNVFEIWREQASRGEPLTVTDPDMKRYFMHIDECVNHILRVFELAEGGEIFVPTMTEFRVIDFAKTDKIKIIGRRKGEKLHEALMSEDEKKRARRTGELWVIR